MAGIFYKLGSALRPSVNKGRWMWYTATGTESDIIKAEQEMGNDLASAMLAETSGTRAEQIDHPNARLVAEIGQSLCRCVADKRRSFTFNITESGEPNAFALPGGHIFITPALIELIGDRTDELAFVLGHEMAHVIKQHSMERMAGDAAMGAVLKTIRFGGKIGPWLKKNGMKMLSSAYSQDRELQADRIGAGLAEAAGYPLAGGTALLQRLSCLYTRQNAPPLAEYFASHPPFNDRIAALESFIAHRKKRNT